MLSLFLGGGMYELQFELEVEKGAREDRAGEWVLPLPGGEAEPRSPCSLGHGPRLWEANQYGTILLFSSIGAFMPYSTPVPKKEASPEGSGHSLGGK